MLKKIKKKCSKLTRFFAIIFILLSKLRTHGQLKIVVHNHVRDDPWHTLVTYAFSEIETQFWQRNSARLSDYMSIIKIIKSINCHLHDEIENSKKRILHYKSGAKISTLRMSLRRYNVKFRISLRFLLLWGFEWCSMLDIVQFL